VWPPQGLFSRNAVDTIDDMDGVRFRVADANSARLAELMGAVPAKTEATEISQAFSTGVADAMMGSGAIGVFQNMWDFVDHFYTVNGWLPKSAVMVNLDAWNSLDEATQQVILAAAEKAEADVWEAAKTVTEEYNATMAENGMTVSAPSDALAGALAEIGAKMAEEWKAEAGEKGAAALDAYQAAN
ncbi:MAG: TRAP transporter substrate-binding protein DctP, partial [Pseudomonadota bacterium]